MHDEDEESAISTRIRPEESNGGLKAGAEPGAGTFFCLGCGTHLSLEESDVLPTCDCGGTSFRRDSIFGPMQEHGHPTSEFPVPAAERPDPPAWLTETRARLEGPGRALAYRDEESGEIRLVPLEGGWLRIGRARSADLRLDHPSVSRRHAIVACEAPKALRILDDRSLNGVQVNGAGVEWSRLGDGDEVTIGHFRLYVLEA